MGDPSSSSASSLPWRYIDDSGDIQGPYSLCNMRSWLEAGYLNGGTKVANDPKAEKDAFKMIKDYPDGNPFGVVKKQGQEGDAHQNDESMTIPEEQWKYKDEKGNTQGPFSDSNMQNWYNAGYFSPETLICKASKAIDDSCFKPLKEVAPEFLPDSIRIPMLKEKKKREDQAKTSYYYVDDDGEEKGPFSEVQMRSWYKKGYFHEDTRVRLSSEKETYPLGTKQCNFKYLPRPVNPAESVSSNVNGTADAKLSTATSQALMNGMGNNAGAPSAAPWLRNMNAGAAPPPSLAPPMQRFMGPSGGLPPGTEDSKWLYLDDNNKEQGPWTTGQMRKWFQNGMLSPHIRIRLVGEPGALFLPISKRPAAFKYPPGAWPPQPSPLPMGMHRPPAYPKNGNPQPILAHQNPTRHDGGRHAMVAQSGGVAMAMQARLDPVSALSKTLDKIDNRQPNVSWTAPNANPSMPRHSNPYQQAQPRKNVNPYTAVASFNLRSGRFSYSGNQTHYQRQGLPENREERMMAHYFDHESWQDQKNAAAAARAAARAVKRRRKQF
mmetsp:Transcript_5361/g.13068  ORF Transcript_5361/g.13068 Transcript_5361/m.13068 type:complete len:549 (+) Transcript_5361:181-1827(+)